MSETMIAGIDQGTTSTRCMIFDSQGRTRSLAQREHHQVFPQPGWAEQDADEIWRHVRHLVPEALAQAGIGPGQVAALGIANQRETSVVWDRTTGRTVAPAITWQDTRTSAIIDDLVARGTAGRIAEVTGLQPRTYFAGPRLRWLLDHGRGLRARAEAGELLFGTMESWLIWNLTGGVDTGVHVTDVTNASRTMLMDLSSREWDESMLDLLDVPRAVLPTIRSNAEVYGTCVAPLPGVPIAGALGDQQAALFGQTCFEPGDAKCTYGTGAFLLVNAGSERPTPGPSVLPTVGYELGDDDPVYAVEGSIAMAGSLVQWLRDSLEIIPSAPQVETLARSVDHNGGCYIVPAFSGLYAPRWDQDARGVIVGLTSFVTKAHLARAVLEATAWQTWEVVEAIGRELGLTLETLRVDGGMTSNHLLMQMLSDVLDVPVERPLVSETVCLGAAYAAGLTVGFWSDLAALRHHRHVAAVWRPQMDADVRAREAAQWNRAVDHALGWVVPHTSPD
ncbi:glycerol kinase [Aeromicrobium chenweiae]|uniref:glycerol kinase n=2 Tax=Aeromicrobium chenweiae TaxID=2079793 RepID=A0A2S0WKH2_9ACTN|nr:glycerol kinase GlpK [Aeromicrobium chenweiae]AWB91797.1 glycerol kinase [Aeromicrobium chenweiae]TGN32641.1 glycerol kinase [Aeromicrobium chenweiae]